MVSLIECTVNYMWRKDGEVIFNNSHYKITDSGLLINNLMLEDAGQYQCIAFNGFGDMISKSVSVVIDYGKILLEM